MMILVEYAYLFTSTRMINKVAQSDISWGSRISSDLIFKFQAAEDGKGVTGVLEFPAHPKAIDTFHNRCQLAISAVSESRKFIFEGAHRASIRIVSLKVNGITVPTREIDDYNSWFPSSRITY